VPMRQGSVGLARRAVGGPVGVGTGRSEPVGEAAGGGAVGVEWVDRSAMSNRVVKTQYTRAR